MNKKSYQLELQKQMDIINAEKLIASKIFSIDLFDKTDFFKALEIVIEMLILLLDGYLSSKLKLNEKVKLDDIMSKHKRWVKVLKKSAYQEEFL